MLKKIFFLAIIIILGIFFLRFIIGGQEDSWLCTETGWVKHGQPVAPMPTELCGRRITNFWECLEAGNLVMESFPRKCQANSQTFIEDIGNELEKIDLININGPRPNDVIGSPLTITGQARGYWFFEASFPIELIDEQGNVLARHYATAQGDWMTEDFVPFSAELEFEAGGAEKGTLILIKDNPSGLPENEDALKVPVLFK